jgi:murein DD-endopeptidase MepM/ murein hydrolase activator NlpD
MNFKSLNKSKIAGIFSFLISLFVLTQLGPKLSNFEPQLNKKNEQEQNLNPVNLACIFQGELDQNESLYLCLLKEKVPTHLIYRLTSVLSEVFNLKKSLPQDSYRLVATPDSILFFEYQKRMEEKYQVKRKNGKLEVSVVPIELNRIVKSMEGEIENSLWESMIKKCQNPELILKLTEVFEWDIDFLTEPQKGDSFRLIFEEYHKDGEFVKYGDILAAEYNPASGGAHLAVSYQDPAGHKDFYDFSGKSLKKAFLKSPLNYRRISSGFSYSRLHPIFKVYRPHLGVDYAAPTGTPVVASGDGVIKYAGWNKGLGKVVEIRHANGFVTSYGHLSNIAKGIRTGVRVNQKDLIGYVGSTGYATGPHLDYRVKANGRYVNPLKMIVPPSKPVDKEFLVDFERKRDNLVYALNLLTAKEILASVK